MFNGFKRDEIHGVAQRMHVDVSPDATIAEVKAALLDAEVSEEDYYNAIGEKKEYSDVPKPQRPTMDDEETVDNTVVDKTEQDEAPTASEGPKKVVGRFLGRNLQFGTAHGKFSRTQPFFEIEQDKLDDLKAKYPNKFRQATKEERKAL